MTPPDQNPDELEDSSRGGSLAWLLWVPVAMMIYFLSVGPAIWVYMHTQNSRTKHALETIYAPLEWATHKPGVGKIIDTYAKWWRDLSEK